MTDVTRVIDGVKTIAMIDQDTDAGQLTQASIDYFGLDKFGNVWILGGYTEDYEGGVFTNSVDAFLGLKGGRAVGILMPANPVLATPRWFIGQTAHEDGSAAEVVEQHSHQCVPFACYDNVLVVREGEVKAIDNEFKFYAPGVGQIMNSPRKDSKHKDTERLANFTQLSRKGLDEIARVVLNLEAHARQTEPKIFGSASMARRFP